MRIKFAYISEMHAMGLVEISIIMNGKVVWLAEVSLKKRNKQIIYNLRSKLTYHNEIKQGRTDNYNLIDKKN